MYETPGLEEDHDGFVLTGERLYEALGGSSGALQQGEGAMAAQRGAG